MKTLKIIALYLAGALLLAHNLVPHQHHADGTAEEHCTVENEDLDHSLLELLGDIFHTDLGDEHLELLQKSERHSLSLFFPATLPLKIMCPQLKYGLEEESSYKTPPDLTLADYLVITLRSLRSPPAYSA